MKLSVAAALAAASAVSAQQSAYQQCGGVSWTGATTCVSGYYCFKQNDYYHQCVPGTASAAPTTSKATSTTKPVSSTTKPVSSSTTLKTSTSVSKTSSAPVSSGSAGTIATTSGTDFVIDGKKGYFAGTNSYWIGFLTYNPDIDLAMTKLQQSGLKVLRVWGFNDVNTIPSADTVYYQSFVTGSTPQINTGANGLQRLDYVVQSAAAHGIKLIINFVNNWDDYGGIKAYTNYYGITHNDWFTHTAAQTQYRAYIKAVVSRYKDSPTVFAWELGNEPRCPGCATSVIYDWAASTSAYIKSLDAKHLVTLGDEGFHPSAGDGSYPFQTGEGVDFAANLKIPTLDFGTLHMYPESWGVNATQWTDLWISEHGKACVAAGKPCVFEEYGYTADHSVEVNWQKRALATIGIAGDMFWQYGVDFGSWKSHDDGHTIYPDTADWTMLVTDQQARIKASGR